MSNSCRELEGLILNGFIPLLHGDCVFDSVRGCTILSGDTILEVGIKPTHCKIIIDYYIVKSSWRSKIIW